MEHCPACGHPIAPQDHFCASCGARVDDAGLANTSVIRIVGANTTGSLAPVQAGARPDLPTGSALLIVHRGPGEGSEFPLDAQADVVTVGRTPDADVFLDDVTVSRRHAELRHGAEGWSIRDVGSLNGTYVNRKRVEDRQLNGGDEVQIGKFRFIFLVGVDNA